MNSRGNGVGTLGAGGGWRSSYDWSCEAIQGSLRSPTPIGYTVRYPDGRVITFSNRLSPYAGPLGVGDHFVPGSGTQIVTLFLADGGKVQFQQRAVQSENEYEFFIDPPTTILDPNNLPTTLAYDGAGGRLSQVTEPAGRFLKIYYNSDYTIDHVDASYPGGPITQKVTYGYTTRRFGGTNYRSLTSASYSDGTAASYIYQRANTVASDTPLISTCDDVRYPGPMKKIAYVFKSSGSYGQLYQETHPSGALVLTLDVNGNKRTETRGDGPHRIWQYGDSAGPANLPYLLKSFSDFRNQGTLLAHDSNGFVSAMTDANNHKTLFEHNAFSGAITKITHPGDGTSIQYIYEDSTGYYLHQTVDERNHGTTYTLDQATHTRREIQYPDGGVEDFSYNNYNQVTEHTMVNHTSAGGSGGTETFIYDTGDRGLLKQSYPPVTPSDPDPSQHPTQYEYDANDHLQTVTDPRGNVTTYKYSERGQLLFIQHPDPDHSMVNNEYYDDSTLKKTTVQFSATRSGITSYIYDDYKRLLTQTAPGDSSGTATHTTSFWYDDAGAGVIDYTHTDANVTRTVLPSGKIVKKAYDENKRLSTVTAGVGTIDAATTGFTYDPVGNLKTKTEPNYYPNGLHWTYYYDPRDRLHDVDDPSSADRNSLGHTVSYTYGPINKTSEQRANDQIITYDSYDAMNRLTQMTVPQTPDPAAVTKYTWTRAGKIATMLDPNGNLYNYAYDAQNRLITSTFPADSEGMVRTEGRTYDFASNLATFTNRAGAVETFTYDQRNRETGYSWVGGSPPPPRTLVYDDASRVLRCNTPNAFIKFFYYDDNLLKSQETWGTGEYGDGLHRTINYSYDGDGNRAGIQYPSSYTFSYSYSGRNQLQTVAQGGSGQLATYGYDASGNLNLRTLANSTASTYGHDEVNRVLNISHALSGTTRTFAYGYNAVSNRTYVQRDMGMGDVFGYDKNDQMTAVLLNITNPTTTGPGGQTVYYDESGNRSYFGAESQSDVYGVNQLNQYTSRDVGVPPTPTPTPTATPTPSATPTPGPADAPTIDPNDHNTCTNPITVTIQSDTPGAWLRIAQGEDPDIDDGFVVEGNFFYTCLLMHSDSSLYYKAKAFLPGLEETTSSAVVTSGAFLVPPPSDCGGGEGGNCDENGPLRPAGGEGTTATATYNGNGAMTSNFDGSAYTYDSMNRLLSASKGGVSVQYYYDGLNRQIARTVNGVATYSVYDGWNLIGEYSSGSTTASLAWVYGATGMIKELVSGNYYYQDSLGSTSHLADSTGALLEWYRYDLQGAPIFYDAGNNPISDSAHGITHLYTGQRWYSALGLYDLRNRYYSPDIGRFLQPDPIGFGGDASNLYRYGGNNPVNRSDPSGLGFWGWLKALLRTINGTAPSQSPNSNPSNPSNPNNGNSVTLYGAPPTGSNIPEKQTYTGTPNSSLWQRTDWNAVTGAHSVGSFALVSGGNFGDTPQFVPAIERSGPLRVDTDGTGPSHSDRTHGKDNQTAYTPNGQSLNADVDPYVAIPTALLSQGVRVGDNAVLIVNGFSAPGVVGDTGADPRYVEGSVAIVHNAGVPTVDIPRTGPVPNTRGGRELDATMIIFLTKYGFY